MNESQGRDRFAMRHRAFDARWGLLLCLLAAPAGCSSFGLRRSIEHGSPAPEQAARAQQISEHAQNAMDQGNYEQARLDLLQLVSQSGGSAEANQRLGTVLLLLGRLAEAESYFRAALER